MSTRPYVVRQGDCLVSLAARHGISVDDLRNQDGNSGIAEQRSDSTVIGAGDIVRVPANPPEPPSITAGGTHRFKAYGATTPLILDMKDPSGEKMSGKPYRLRVGRRVIEGQTNGQGRIEARVPTSARTAELTVWANGPRSEDGGARWTLEIGHMDPEEHASGTVARLSNLGFPVHPGPGGLENTLKVFQQSAGLPVTGQLDEATRRALRDGAGV